MSVKQPETIYESVSGMDRGKYPRKPQKMNKATEK